AERVSNPSFTADVIVGFPGETEAQFRNTLDVCRRVGFSRVHVFPYSRRRGTDAAGMPDLPGRVKKERRLRLERLAAELTDAYARRFLGQEVVVLREIGSENGGYTDRYLKARVPGAPNTFVRVRVERIEHGEIHGTPA
ncbi:MAG TPA: tRNA (N(6)-L-threonylcarbamoyladenosine(37)-C(2))-methylthiotransferase MtaB, partial [Planctomycetota bacterium]|nr:tRNA (N(6)-L-threonylcarbamoyladenosine(37)-C(2))-methylthiotransferase MtaB [Planctomycetota bacterium]